MNDSLIACLAAQVAHRRWSAQAAALTTFERVRETL